MTEEFVHLYSGEIVEEKKDNCRALGAMGLRDWKGLVQNIRDQLKLMKEAKEDLEEKLKIAVNHITAFEGLKTEYVVNQKSVVGKNTTDLVFTSERIEENENPNIKVMLLEQIDFLRKEMQDLQRFLSGARTRTCQYVRTIKLEDGVYECLNCKTKIRMDIVGE